MKFDVSSIIEVKRKRGAKTNKINSLKTVRIGFQKQNVKSSFWANLNERRLSK